MAHRVVIGLLLAATLIEQDYARPSGQDIGSSIAAHVEAGDLSTFYPSTDLERARLTKLYEPSAFKPMWVDAAGRRTARAREATAILGNAGDDGLNPARYTLSLNDLAATLDSARWPGAAQASQYELALSAAMLRYLNDARHGAIDPRTLGIGLPAPIDGNEVVTCLRDAVDRGRVADAVACARPVMNEYALLRDALKRYRTLAAPVERGTALTATIHPGDRFEGAARLRARLMAFGDLPSFAPSAAADGGVYTGALVDGVKRFQSRHGLDVDGVIGRATWHELSVPPAQRIRQIELALERLRWLPHRTDGPLLVLNIPMFELYGWDDGWRGAPAFTMKTIVGRRVTPTPAFSKTMESVIFRPYWNVPRSILRHELLPALRKDPGLLEREGMEIVRGDGDDADVVAATDGNLRMLARGVLRLRQRPGPKNALGFIKFVLPNEEQVYLHGTPAQRLFARSRRDFSHGCVRVEDPVALAEWVFSGSDEWGRERILETIADLTIVSSQVRLQRQVQVIFVYTTAAAAPDGSVRFAPDIYDKDAALDRALRRRG